MYEERFRRVNSIGRKAVTPNWRRPALVERKATAAAMLEGVSEGKSWVVRGAKGLVDSSYEASISGRRGDTAESEKKGGPDVREGRVLEV